MVSAPKRFPAYHLERSNGATFESTGGGEASLNCSDAHLSKVKRCECRNKRTTWSVTFEPQKEKHYASYPTRLIEPMVLAGTDAGDIVLDPFSGTATTGLVALRNNRRYIGLELNPDYIEISERRLRKI